MAGNFASQKDCLEFHDQGVDTFFFACLRENMEIEALKRSLETLEWQTLLGMPQNEWSAKDVESEDAVNNAILNLPISTIHQILQDISQHQPASDSLYIPSHFKDVEPLQSTSNFIPEKDSSCYKTGFLPASNGYSSAISFTESGTRNHSISTTVENAYHKAARPIVLGDGKEIIPQHGSSYVFQNVPDSSFWYTAQELSETKAEELGRMIRSYPVELLESELQIPSMQQESTTKKRNILRPNGRKDRHSKVKTAKGLRDRRVRLSVLTATQFYEIQDRLGYDHPSKAVEWLMKKAKQDIDELPPANLCSNEGSQC